MDTIEIDAGTLEFSEEDLTATGLLVPYGEECRSNLGVFSVDAGIFKIPTDLTGMSLNVEHARENVVGAFSAAHEQADGIVGTYKFSATDEGRAAFKEAKEGQRKHLSAEVSGVKIKDGKATAGRLFAAALVEKPAFPSATLLAAAVDTEPAIAPVDETPQPLEVAEDGSLSIDTNTTPDVVNIHPADSETAVTFTKGDSVPDATIPSTLTAAAPAAPARSSIHDVASALALFSRTGDKSGIDGLAEKFDEGANLFAALSDVKLTTTGGVGVAIQQPQWIGQLWDGRNYARRVIPLIGSAPLTSFKVSGFRWTTKPAMASWAGDKAAITSNAPATEAYSVNAARYAGAHDIAREFRDFDVPEFWEAYFKAMTDSYAKLTDDDALTALVGGATAVTAGTVPTGVNAGLVSIVDGALAVLPEGAPSFALVASDVYRSIALTRDVDKLAFLNTSLGLEEGTLTEFKIVPHPSIATGKVLVGVKAAATSFELAGSPIRTEALDQIKGGIDEALFGYAAVTIDNPAALALVTPHA